MLDEAAWITSAQRALDFTHSVNIYSLSLCIFVPFVYFVDKSPFKG